MIIDLIKTLRTVLNLCVLAVWRQKQPLIFSCIVITIILLDLHCLMSFVKANLSLDKFLNIILSGSSHFKDSQNQSILNSTIRYITNSNRFSGSVF